MSNFTKKISFLLFLKVILLVFSKEAFADEVSSKSRILIFTCQYRQGHKMATQGISESLKEYELEIVDMYNDPLKSLDPMRKIFPQLSNEKLYNDMAKKEQNKLLNFAGKFGPKVLIMQRKKIEKVLKKYIEKKKPDLVISCIPLVNPMLEKVTEKLQIPFLVITTDIDITAFCEGFSGQKVSQNKTKFKITVPYAEEPWNDLFLKKVPKEVKPYLCYSFGYPTRQKFSENFDDESLKSLRQEYGIQEDEHVILIMMGGNSAEAALYYAKHLLMMKEDAVSKILAGSTVRTKIRLICLCGDITKKENLEFYTKLNDLNKSSDKKNELITICAAPATSKIAEIVSLPELFTVISKPGGSTVNEMIKKKTPMVYHVPNVTLD